MHYLTSVHSDIGIQKKVNQDSLCLKIAQTSIGDVLMAIVCDGMGGLQKGELASKIVVEAFSNWFDKRLPVLIQNGLDLVAVGQSWNTLVKEYNLKIYNFSKASNIEMGTTLVAILMIDNKAIICNIGDSRCYSIRKTIKQLSRDHTQIEKLIRENQISRDEAQNDPRSSMLTQCIGVSANANPDFFQVVTEEGMGFLLCSDGFRHKVKEEEIKGVLHPSILFDESTMKTTLIDLTELNKSRGETDNITSIYIKII